MNPCPTHDQFNRLLTESLSASERLSVELHIEQCPRCQQLLEQMTHDSVIIPINRSTWVTDPARLHAGDGRSEPQIPSSRPTAGGVSDHVADHIPERTPHGATANAETVPFRSGHGAQDPPKDLTGLLAPAQAPDEIGRLGSYRLQAVLGKGGMGVVYRAEDPHLERLVALKVMRPELLANLDAKQRFFREARSAAALKHPHIVTIYQVGEENGVPFLAMEYLEGETLEQRLNRESRLRPAEVSRIGREVADGLAAAHAHGLMHRDVKPANIWLEAPAGHVKLLDFGLARAFNDPTHQTKEGIILGTPAFMAPEQAAGNPVGPRSDLFSLGVVLYRIATGVMPFQGADPLAILSALASVTPPPPRAVNPAVPKPLSELVVHLLAKKPEQRPASAREVAAALAAHEESASLPPMPRWRRRLLGPVAAAVVVLGSIAAGLLFLGKPALGTLVVNVPEAGVQVFIDGEAWGAVSPSKTCRILVSPGVHRLTVERAGHEVYAQSFAMKTGGETEIEAQWNPKQFTNSLGMEFVLVPKGKAWLGGYNNQPGDQEVDIPHDFYLGKYEVTQGEWRRLMHKNPSWFSRSGEGSNAVKNIAPEELDRFPVEQVSWSDTRALLEALNQQEHESEWVYRLPSVREWEYACRGGPMADRAESTFEFYFETPSKQMLESQANFNNHLQRTCKVGSYPPNRLGLHDMHGNVWEWTNDTGQATSGAGWWLCGGAWNDGTRVCQARVRHVYGVGQTHTRGLRVARVKPIPATSERRTHLSSDRFAFHHSLGACSLCFSQGNQEKTVPGEEKREEKVSDTMKGGLGETGRDTV